MKKVTLLGDSIRLIGYGNSVPSLLGSEYEVWQPTDNCRFAEYTLRMLFDFRKEIESSDIVHFNCGLWDVTDIFGDGNFTPLDVYVEQMKRVTSILKRSTDKLIFATTTPVTARNPYNDNETICRYNAAIVPELEKMGVKINDLYTPLSKDIDRFIRSDDNIHLTEDGIKVAASLVSEAIKNIG